MEGAVIGTGGAFCGDGNESVLSHPIHWGSDPTDTTRQWILSTDGMVFLGEGSRRLDEPHHRDTMAELARLSFPPWTYLRDTRM